MGTGMGYLRVAEELSGQTFFPGTFGPKSVKQMEEFGDLGLVLPVQRRAHPREIFRGLILAL